MPLSSESWLTSVRRSGAEEERSRNWPTPPPGNSSVSPPTFNCCHCVLAPPVSDTDHCLWSVCSCFSVVRSRPRWKNLQRGTSSGRCSVNTLPAPLPFKIKEDRRISYFYICIKIFNFTVWPFKALSTDESSKQQRLIILTQYGFLKASSRTVIVPLRTLFRLQAFFRAAAKKIYTKEEDGLKGPLKL